MVNTYTILLQALISPASLAKVQEQINALKGIINIAPAGGKTLPGGGGGNLVPTSANTVAVNDFNAALRDMNVTSITVDNTTGQVTRAMEAQALGVGQVEKHTISLNKNLTDYANKTTTASVATKGWAGDISNAIEKMAMWAIAGSLLFGTLRKIGEGTQYIKDLNKELTNISIVTGMTQQQTYALGQQYNQLAQQMGVTTQAIAQGSLEWFRQGKTIEQTTELMTSSLMMATLGNMTAADATEKLTATLNGFQMQSEESISVVDRLVALDNKYATSVGEIATAMQYSAAVAKQAGVTFNELASYITVVSSVTRMSAETVGQSLKTMLTRMEQVKLGQMFEDDTTTISNVAESLHNVGIEIMATSDTFKPMGDVLDELGQKWGTLTQKQQNAIAGTVAGKFYARTYSNIWEYV